MLGYNKNAVDCGADATKIYFPYFEKLGNSKSKVSVNQIPNLPVDRHGTKAESQALLFPSLYGK